MTAVILPFTPRATRPRITAHAALLQFAADLRAIDMPEAAELAEERAEEVR